MWYVHRVDAGKSWIRIWVFTNIFLKKLKKNISSILFGSSRWRIQILNYALVKLAKVEKLIYWKFPQNAENARLNTANNAWWSIIKVLVIKISKNNLNNGKDVQNVKYLSKKMRGVIIWHVAALINSASFALLTGKPVIINVQ